MPICATASDLDRKAGLHAEASPLKAALSSAACPEHASVGELPARRAPLARAAGAALWLMAERW